MKSRDLILNHGYELYPHQLEALEFMTRREQDPTLSGGILCMKQGLGKTLTSIVYALINP